MTPKEYTGNLFCLMATDVEALFPSLDSVETARVVKEMIRRSKVRLEDFSLEDALLSIHLTGLIQTQKQM